MDATQARKIINERSKERLSATAAERELALYIKEKCASLGLEATLEEFAIETYEVEYERLTVDSESVFCKSCYGSGSGVVSAPVFYMPNVCEVSFEKCKDRIVLLDDPATIENYRAITAAGAAGIICRYGNIQYKSDFIRRGEFRFGREVERHVPCVRIGTENFVKIAKNSTASATLEVEVRQHEGRSVNLLLDLPGELDEWIVIAAHIDSTEESLGAYDNLTGCIAMLYMAEYFKDKKLRRGIRFLWCGSEERGLLGSAAYCRDHAEDNEKTVLNVTLDMLGAATGPFVSYACSNEQNKEVLDRFAREHSRPNETRYMLRSTDVKPFVYAGIAAVSFARYANPAVAPIHTEFDTPDAVDEYKLIEDAYYVAQFVEYVADSDVLPLDTTVSEQMREEATKYMQRDQK